jgi:ketosteroid isomerase-like protein
MNKMFFLLLFTSLFANAQKDDRNLRSLIDAEKAFSKMSVDKNLREAFIYFFAPNSVSIVDGKEVNGLEEAKKMKVDSSLVVWEPVVADISSLKDFGYTTGPVKFYRSHSDTVPAGSIYYSTVWEKQPSGEWKVIFDLGSAKGETVMPAFEYSKKPLPLSAGLPYIEDRANEVLKIDREYTAALNAKNITVVPSYFSDEGRVHRPRIFPVKGKEAIEAFSDPKDRRYTYKHLNYRIAKSGDMAFTYGTVDVIINPGTDQKTAQGRYFRVWKRESGGWKIVLDVLG